jgi:hypothetical protein
MRGADTGRALLPYARDCLSVAAKASAELTFEDIYRQPVITYNTESGLWPLISGAFEAKGVALNVRHASNDVPLQVALAAERIGVAVSAGSDPALLDPRGVTVVPLRPAIR